MNDIFLQIVTFQDITSPEKCFLMTNCVYAVKYYVCFSTKIKNFKTKFYFLVYIILKLGLFKF